MQFLNLVKIVRRIDNEFHLAFVLVQKVSYDIRANTGSFVTLKEVVSGRRIRIPKLRAHGDKMGCDRCENRCICFECNVKCVFGQLAAEFSEFLGLNKRLSSCHYDVFACIACDYFDGFFDIYVLVFWIPRRIGRVTKIASQITVAGSEEHGGDAAKFALALYGVEEFAKFHVDSMDIGLSEVYKTP